MQDSGVSRSLKAVEREATLTEHACPTLAPAPSLQAIPDCTHMQPVRMQPVRLLAPVSMLPWSYAKGYCAVIKHRLPSLPTPWFCSHPRRVMPCPPEGACRPA